MNRIRTRESDFDDFAPMTVGRGSRAEVLNSSVDITGLQCGSQLDQHLVHLMTLHPSIGLRFSKQNLSQLDEVGKRELLEDMNELLGIKG